MFTVYATKNEEEEGGKGMGVRGAEAVAGTTGTRSYENSNQRRLFTEECNGGVRFDG